MSSLRKSDIHIQCKIKLLFLCPTCTCIIEMLRTIAADKNYTNKKNISLFGSGIYIQIEHPLVPGSVVLV